MSSSLLRKIESSRSIAVTGHIRPDGDCIGSCLGLRNYILDNYPGKTVRVYLGEASGKFAYLQGFDGICHDPEEMEAADLLVCLDASDRERLGAFAGLLDMCGDSWSGDHHATHQDYTAETCLDADSSSACEVLYEQLDPEKISRRTAECLYTGIVHDTGVFQYAATSPRTMEIAGRLMACGIDHASIIGDSFFSRTWPQQRIKGFALERSKLLLDGKFVWTMVTLEDMEAYGVNYMDLEGIVASLRETEGAEVALFLYQMSEKDYKISLRSDKTVDVSRIAAEFSGGGHIRAAGGSTEDPEKALERITELVREQL